MKAQAKKAKRTRRSRVAIAADVRASVLACLRGNMGRVRVSGEHLDCALQLVSERARDVAIAYGSDRRLAEVKLREAREVAHEMALACRASGDALVEKIADLLSGSEP